MDDARIRDLTNEVLAALDRGPDARASQSLEARVAALTAATAGPPASRATAASSAATSA